jgi:predicted ATPase
MGSLPTGTVTFLFTDIEGSTRLVHSLGEAGYAEALAAHRAILREAFAENGGVEVDTQGDAFFVAFPTAPGAIAAAGAATDRLAGGPISVRIGIHSGTPFVTDEGYVGVDVHRAARIAACGHGGQTLVSAATAGLIDAAAVRDLGEHRLKDLSAPERIYQLGEAEFPPLKSLYRTNLPVPATPFLGRERELAELAALLAADDPRLVTLTGPGGVGKTRLALQAAGAAGDFYPHGVFWVPVAPLRDPTDVLPAATQAVGAKGNLADHIADRRLLLVLDNLEHLTDVAPQLAELLAACPNLRLLVTSRELLRVPGEQAYPVPELQPEDGRRLFLARALAAQPTFAASPVVTELCARLEHLPLALELAAARVRVLTPEQLLERLSGRLDLLKAGRGVDPRQQTLRATIEWSHELLDDDEKHLFAQLAVFVGGWTLAAAERVCEADLDTLQSLVDKSLVRAMDGGRFFMLETIREFAAESLEASGEATALRRRHADYLLAEATDAAPGLASGRIEQFDRLESDLPNYRAAFAWLLVAAPADALRLADGLRDFWFARGYLHEGRRWFAAALATDAHDDALRARMLSAASILASLQADWPETRRLAEESTRVSTVLGDPTARAQSLLTLGRVFLAEGAPGRALELFDEADAVATAAGAGRIVGMARFNSGYLELERGDYAAAQTRFESAHARFTEIDNTYGQARALAALGAIALHDDRFADAVEPLRESIELAHSMGDRENLAWALELLGVARSATDAQLAAELLGAAESLRELLGSKLEGIELTLHERAVASLGGTDDAWAAGRALAPEDAAALALAQPANAS